MAVLCAKPTIQYSAGRALSAISNLWFLGPTQDLYANGISIASAVFAGLIKWQTDRQTDKPRYSVGNNRRHLLTQYCDCGLIITVADVDS